ncbi:XLF-domain-containing protein [Hyaloscypha hepaticicola]|uniref:Non-homologous end-joining factor 1 n=1 Tax=Hyaloscypha hepaticicola TaxID=2082293 RepID=A0A2J6Q3M6_9HELO|nr:XLF-domain-containing protein [Hyaloscypha hepaticicola]
MAWKPLRISPSAAGHLPPLLISQSFRPSSYTVQLTDLTYIWSESLDRRGIIRRSREQNTSIDPSDGDQMQIFLDKVKSGLAGGKDTTLALTISADRPSLVLNINVKLPGGLDPLEWPIQLAAAPQSLMTSQFTIPLLKAQHAKVQDIESLAEVVKEKDHVIQKLLDKLEGQGTELGQIFPQAAGRVGRKVDRKQAVERVKGLGQFNMDAWRKSRDHEILRDAAGLSGDVFGGNSAEGFEVEISSPATEESEHWWESIKGITINLDTGKFSTNGLSGARKTPPKPKPALKKEETIEDDDAFQVQVTPPRLTRSPKRTPSKVVIDDSTDDDELDAPTQRSKIPDSFPISSPPVASSSKKTKKLGSVGAKKAAAKIDPPDEEITEDEASPPHISDGDKSTASPTPPPEKTVPEKPQRKLGRIGGKKEAPPPEPELEAERDTPPPPAKTIPAPETVKPKKGKLGQIGAKNRRAETPPPTEEAPEASKTETPKRKLGAIGHKHQSPATKKKRLSQPEELEIRGRTSVNPEKEKTPQPRETSEERADRKRQELKRELEEKAKAPVKKKRKF